LGAQVCSPGGIGQLKPIGIGLQMPSGCGVAGRLARDLTKTGSRSGQPGALVAESRQRLNRAALAFTLAPHLQPINHCDCFSPFGGI